MENVLRVMDVIPPFGSPHISDRPSPRHVPAGPSAPMASAPAPDPGLNGQNVPTLDLGEKILAEQRRRTARTRRAPGADDPVVDIDRAHEEAMPEPLKPASSELAQLQDIVAEIVARDIDRLCAGLAHTSHGPRCAAVR